MKHLTLIISLLLPAIAVFAQSDKYQTAMQKNLALLDSAKSSEDFANVTAAFERIGDAEKTQWLPYYYASLATIQKGFMDQKSNKDEVANAAEALIAKAESIEPNNAEIFIIKNMIASMRLLVDPQNRWQRYGAEGSAALAKAKQIDPTNPRIYFLEGQTVFYTPAQFGGGKDKAKPILEKSVELFGTYKAPSSLYPSWGLKMAEQMLALCK